jgi:hypothetical protein
MKDLSGVQISEILKVNDIQPCRLRLRAKVWIVAVHRGSSVLHSALGHQISVSWFLLAPVAKPYLSHLRLHWHRIERQHMDYQYVRPTHESITQSDSMAGVWRASNVSHLMRFSTQGPIQTRSASPHSPS